MVYLLLENYKVPLGNFTFIFDLTQNVDLFYKFYNAEKNIKIDYIDFAHKIRLAFEAFALEEEAKKRKLADGYKKLPLDVIKEKILTEIKEPASLINYKNIVIDLCNGREMEFGDVLLRYFFVKKVSSEEDVRRKLKAYIRFIYAFGSENSHENVSVEENLLANKENCFRVIGSFHDFLCVYYRVDKKYDCTLIPIRDYIPVPKAVVEKMGLSLDSGKYLFVKECRGKIAFYIFSSDREDIGIGQRRDMDTLSKLWEDNLQDPANVIRKTDSISSSNGDYKFQIYSLPGKPLRLSLEFLQMLSLEEKLDIISGLCKGLESVHRYETPLYHRNVNPDAFYIFSIRGKYKPLLAKFDCIKDTGNAEFTVQQNVERKMRNPKTNHFFAPEVLKNQMGQGVDWKKADVFALGKTCLYILSGGEIDDEDIEKVIDGCDVNDDVKIVLMEMLSSNPADRPELVELMDALVDQGT